MRPRTIVGLAAAAGVAVFVRRRRSARQEHVALYYSDGSSISLEYGAPEGERMIELAQTALRLARA